MGDMFQQPILEVENPAVFEPVKAAIEAAFAPPSVGKFLDHAERARVRILPPAGLDQPSFAQHGRVLAR